MRAAVLACLASGCGGEELFVAALTGEAKAALVYYARGEGQAGVAFEPVPLRVTLEEGRASADLLLYEEGFEAYDIELNGDRVLAARGDADPVDTIAVPTPAAWFTYDDGELVRRDTSEFGAAFAKVRLPRPPCAQLRVEHLVDLDTYAHVRFAAPVSDEALIIGLGPFRAPRPGFTDHDAELRRVTVDGWTPLEVPTSLADTLYPVGARVAPGDVRVLMRAPGDGAVLRVDAAGRVTRTATPAAWVGEPLSAAGATIGGAPRLFALERSGAIVEHSLDDERSMLVGRLARPACEANFQIAIDARGVGHAIGNDVRLSRLTVSEAGVSVEPHGDVEANRCAGMYARDERGFELFLSVQEGEVVAYFRRGEGAPLESLALPGVRHPYAVTIFEGHVVVGELTDGLAIIELEPTPRVCPGVAQGVSAFMMTRLGPYLVATGSVNTEGLANRVIFLSPP